MPTEKQIHARIWRALREHGPQKLADLAIRVDIPEGVLRAILQEATDHIEVRDEIVRIRHQVLDRLPGPEEPSPMDWVWSPPVEIAPTPDAWRDPNVPFIRRRKQGERGTCGGRGGGQARDSLYLDVTRDFPTEEEISELREDIVDPSGVVHDTGLLQQATDQGIYEDSRIIGGVTYPSGTSAPFVCRALLKIGAGFEDMWPTSTVVRCVYQVPPGMTREEYDMIAAFHRIKGYAELRTWEDIIAALNTPLTKVIMSIKVFANYGDMQGGDGTYPRPKDILNVAGGHLQWICGFSKTATAQGWLRPGYLEPAHTWGTWCGRIGKISREYFDMGFLQAYALMADPKEVARIREGFVTVIFTCNLRANVYINRRFIGTTPDVTVKASLQKGVEVEVFMEAIEYHNLNKSAPLTPTVEEVYPMELVPPEPQPEPQKGLLDRILDWLRRHVS